MLATLSCGLTIDGFGPISDNAGGIAAARPEFFLSARQPRRVRPVVYLSGPRLMSMLLPNHLFLCFLGLNPNHGDSTVV